MPEGHTIHRLAADHDLMFGGRPLRASSPQGKFSDGAALVDGQVLEGAEAHGKHLFLGFGPSGWVHIHLGLFGKYGFGDTPAPPPTDTVRLRLMNDDAYADLRGPTTCALITDGEKRAIHDRLGPDPLRAADTGEKAWQRDLAQPHHHRRPAHGPEGRRGRRQRLPRRSPLPARHRPLPAWARTSRAPSGTPSGPTSLELMREGVRLNRIDTVRPEHTPEAMGRPPRVDDHGGEVYVYRRAHQPCHICGGEIRTADLAARNLFWCPGCQQR